MPKRRYKKPRSRRKRQRELRALIIGCLVIIGIGLCVIYPLYNLVKPYLLYIGIAAGITIAYLTYRFISKFLKARRTRGELHSYLIKALEAMDSTHKTYTNEEEANRELVAILKIQGFKAIYQFRLSHGRYADAKVDNTLIEGKLAPTTEEVDRLLGQLQAYSETRYKIYIVIYGRIGKGALHRIQNEINQRYLGKMSIAYLKNPKRKRKIEV
jgi:hypothetical protein